MPVGLRLRDSGYDSLRWTGHTNALAAYRHRIGLQDFKIETEHILEICSELSAVSFPSGRSKLFFRLPPPPNPEVGG